MVSCGVMRVEVNKKYVINFLSGNQTTFFIIVNNAFCYLMNYFKKFCMSNILDSTIDSKRKEIHIWWSVCVTENFKHC